MPFFREILTILSSGETSASCSAGPMSASRRTGAFQNRGSL